MENNFKINKDDNRFELAVGDYTAFIEYKFRDEDVMALTHTEVPGEAEGKGVGSQLVEKTLLYIKEHNLKVLPLCSFVAQYVSRHPQWNDIVAK